MGTIRRQYDAAFKQEAVRMVQGGRTQKQVAEELGVNPNLLGRWAREFRVDPEQSFPGNGNLKARGISPISSSVATT